MSDSADPLHEVVVPFADDIADLLTTVFAVPVVVDVKELRERYVVRLDPPIELTIDGEPLATLSAEYRCMWDSARTFLAVEKSTIKLTALVDRAPIIRFEYERDAHSKPTGHIQVHGHRGALSHLLSRAHHSSPHSMESLHLPVGGARFRPCLEDVVQFLIQDCRFEAEPDWLTRVEVGREKWRRLQLRSAVRDVPAEAADALRAIGYKVEEPEGGPPSRGSATLRVW